MFYHYEIVSNNNEEILYLYINMKYEFAEDFDINNQNDLERRTSSFIKTNNIKFRGNKIYLVVNGVIVKSLWINKSIGTTKNIDYSYEKYLVNLKLDDNSFCEVTLKEYILSVLLSKYMDFIPEEVFKAMAILYNTFAYKMMMDNGFLLSNNAFAIYKPITYYKSAFDNYDEIREKLENAINEVDCLFLSYNGELILPFIHYSNNGRTLGNTNYPYLASVSSLWDMISPYYIEVNTFSYGDLSKKLGIEVNNNSKINIVTKEKHKNIIINNRLFSTAEFKTLLGLKSTDMYFIIDKNDFRVITRGWGNFYGLSLYGATEISKNGGKYNHILKYYFPRTSIYKYTKELS